MGDLKEIDNGDDFGELTKISSTMQTLQSRFNPPVPDAPVKKKAGRPRKKCFPMPIPDAPVTYEEVLFREAMVALIRSFEVRSVPGLLQASKIADEYVKMIKTKFDKE